MTARSDTAAAIVVTQGNYAVSDRPGSMLSAVLGSCVAVCLWDPLARVGGMNHILVARSARLKEGADMAGINAMELLLNGLFKRGASRARLRCKAFGGAAIVPGLSRAGALNAGFVVEYLENEQITCLGVSMGGTQARQIRFYPVEGRVMMRIVADDQVIQRERARPRPQVVAGNDVELF